jgi:hypothetical protein
MNKEFSFLVLFILPVFLPVSGFSNKYELYIYFLKYGLKA